MTLISLTGLVMGTGMPTFVWQTIPHAQDLQAQIRSDLVNFWPIVQWFKAKI